VSNFPPAPFPAAAAGLRGAEPPEKDKGVTEGSAGTLPPLANAIVKTLIKNIKVGSARESAVTSAAGEDDLL
jgi:hypothetical protein